MSPKRPPQKYRKNIKNNLLFALLLLILLLAGAWLAFYFYERSAVANKTNKVPGELKPAAETVAPDSLENEPIILNNTAPDIAKTPKPSPAKDEPLVPPASKTVSNEPPASSPPPAALPAEPPVVIDPSLIFGSFFDSFPSPAFINLEQTTLYQDKIATAIFFPPDYDWQPADDAIVAQFKNSFTLLNFNNFNGPYLDRRCLNANCLEQRWNDLYYNDLALAAPAEVKNGVDTGNYQVIAVSIFSLSERWLVGYTLKDKNGGYKGAVFYFNGQKFTPLITPATAVKISSPYFGLVGGGGEENDFLVVYGAYKGIAYRIQGNKITDISRFFDIRAMNNGFKAEVIRAAYENNINWYVFSSTLYRPWFIKLWQNGTSEIVGEAVFNDLVDSVGESVAFKLIKTRSDEIAFLANIKNNNQDFWQVFTDRGFKNDQAAALQFKPISRGPEISIKKIAASRLDLDSPSAPLIKFLFSSDAGRWQEIPSGPNADFSAPGLKQFFLKVTFPSFKDKFYSPFLASVLFDYYYQK